MIADVVELGLSAAINPILVGVVLVTLAPPRPKALLHLTGKGVSAPAG